MIKKIIIIVKINSLYNISIAIFYFRLGIKPLFNYSLECFT